jgi:hypothetical protein
VVADNTAVVHPDCPATENADQNLVGLVTDREFRELVERADAAKTACLRQQPNGWKQADCDGLHLVLEAD